MVRMQQRGVTPRDVDLVMEFGEECDDGFVMTKKARTAAIRELRLKLQRIERLDRVILITHEHVVVTTYRADRHRIKKLLGHCPSRKVKRGPVVHGRPRSASMRPQWKRGLVTESA